MRPKTAVWPAIIFSGTVGLYTTAAWPQGQPGNLQPSPTFPRGSQPPGGPTEPGPGPQNQQQLPRDPLTQPGTGGINPALPGTTGQQRQQQPGGLQSPGTSPLPDPTGRGPSTQPNFGGTAPGQTQKDPTLPGATGRDPFTNFGGTGSGQTQNNPTLPGATGQPRQQQPSGSIQGPGSSLFPPSGEPNLGTGSGTQNLPGATGQPGSTKTPGASGSSEMDNQLKGGSSRGDTQLQQKGTEMGGLSSKEEVRKAQQALQAKGFDPGSTDGALSSRTREAVLSFQMANGLQATGTLNSETAAKLGVQQAGSPLPQSGSSIESSSGASGKSFIEGSAGIGAGSSMGADQKSGTSGTASPRSGPGSSKSSGGRINR